MISSRFQSHSRRCSRMNKADRRHYVKCTPCRSRHNNCHSNVCLDALCNCCSGFLHCRQNGRILRYAVSRVYSCCGTHLRHDIPSGQKSSISTFGTSSLEMFTRAEEPFLPWKIRMLLTNTLLDFNMPYTSFSTTPVSILDRKYGMLRRPRYVGVVQSRGQLRLWWKQSVVVSALSVWKVGHGSVVVSVTGVFGHSSVLQQISSVYPA